MQLKNLSSRSEQTIDNTSNFTETIQALLDAPDGPLIA